MKKFIAMALAATLAFGSSVMVFADATTTTAGDTTTAVVAPAEGAVVAEVAPVVPVVEVAPVVEEVVVPVPVKIAFTGVTKNYVAPSGEFVAQYVSFKNNEALTKKMLNLVNDKYFDVVINQGAVSASTSVDLVITFNVEETLTAAKIEYVLHSGDRHTSKLADAVIGTYYVNKATNAEITAAAYAELLAAETAEAPAVTSVVESEATTEVVESVMLALRSYAEGLGYEVAWDNGKVTVSKDDVVVSLETGSTAYVNAAGETVELEAPENINGTLFVPQEFFTVVLGVEIVVE